MKEFAGKIAVVTGGGSRMGRELVRQLAAEACNIAMCDVSEEGMAETRRLCESAGLPQGLRITAYLADVSDELQVERFRDEVSERHGTDKIHLLFNNAGIGGGGSIFAHSREEWERTFNVCWGGVYNCTRAFLPMLQKAEAIKWGGKRHEAEAPGDRCHIGLAHDALLELLHELLAFPEIGGARSAKNRENSGPPRAP